jgi:hypothetical protein
MIRSLPPTPPLPRKIYMILQKNKMDTVYTILEKEGEMTSLYLLSVVNSMGSWTGTKLEPIDLIKVLHKLHYNNKINRIMKNNKNYYSLKN